MKRAGVFRNAPIGRIIGSAKWAEGRIGLPLWHEESMTLRVHFRGVGVYVANTPGGRIAQVLFPDTATAPPDGEDITTPRNAKPKKYKHADGSESPQHFPGAILKYANGREEPFDLTNANVRRSILTGTRPGAVTDGAFTTLIPPLDDIILPWKQLSLLKASDRQTSADVTTLFSLDGDDETEINSIEPSASSHHSWVFASANGVHSAEPYRLEGLWTIEATRAEFAISDRPSGTPSTRGPIKMSADAPDLYVFNFYEDQPSLDKLLAVHPATVGKVDDDFKWAYRLFKKGDSDWKKWLGGSGRHFPAPILTQRPFSSKDNKLPSVSTCFQLVWTGADET